MASAIPIDHRIAGEQRARSGEFFTFAMGTATKVAEPAAAGRAGRDRTRPGGQRHSAGGDGHPA